MTSVPDADLPGTVVAETPRLTVRDWLEADADRMFDMYSRPEVVRFLGSVPTPMTERRQALERIAARRESNAAERRTGSPCGWWAVEVRDTGVVAGTVALARVLGSADPAGAVEVAWHLHPDAQGHGYATEAAAAVLRRGHESGISEVLALTDPANEPSQAVCRRVGLELVETTDRFYGKPLMVWVSRRPA